MNAAVDQSNSGDFERALRRGQFVITAEIVPPLSSATSSPPSGRNATLAGRPQTLALASPSVQKPVRKLSYQPSGAPSLNAARTSL